MRYWIVIDDAGIPRSHRGVLQHKVAPQLSPSLELRWISDLGSSVHPNWGVSEQVARALGSRLAMLMEASPADRILYLPGNCLVQGDLEPLLNACPEEAVVCSIPATGQRLVELEWFVVNRRAPGWPSLASGLRGVFENYDALSDYPPPVAASLNSSTGLSDIFYDAVIRTVTPLQERPWYNADASEAANWTQDLLGALQAGVVSEDDVSSDVACGLARPSLRFQVRHWSRNGPAIPEGVRHLDRHFVPPELAMERSAVDYLLDPNTANQNRKALRSRRSRKVKRAMLERINLKQPKVAKAARPTSPISRLVQFNIRVLRRQRKRTITMLRHITNVVLIRIGRAPL